MPIVRLYPESEVSPQPLPDVMPTVAAAGDIDLFGGNRAGDLQLAGHHLGQASDTLAALHQRHAQQANDTRVQDFTNRFLDGRRAILQTAPDAYYTLSGADAIKGGDVARAKLTALRDELLGETANPYQRERLAPVLDSHLAASATGIMRHTVEQQEVYSRGVATRSIETARAEAIAGPAMIDNAVYRAEGAARVLHAGQQPEAVEAGVRAAGGSIIASVIGDRLARNDPMGVTLFRQHADRLDDHTRRTLGAAADTLSNTLAAEAWLRDRSATLSTSEPTGDAALDAVNAATATTAESPPVISSRGVLLDQDGIVGTRERLGEIETRRNALTALNEQEFATNPARRRANQTAIDLDTAHSRAAVKAETDTLYAELRRHLTTGGPDGGPAITAPPATIMGRLTERQQDAVTAQINANIEGRAPHTDPQTWYAIRQGLTSDDGTERQRWASKNLTQLMGQLSTDDLAWLEELQTQVHTGHGGAEQRRLQAVVQSANAALRAAGLDPTPQPDAPPVSDAAQAARFHRAVQDALSTVERRTGRPATPPEAQAVVQEVKDAAVADGWLEVRETAPTMPSSRNDGEGQWVDPNVVWVAGDDKDRKKSESIPDRFPGSGSSVGADRMPRVLQIDPEAPSGGVGFAPPLAPPFRAGGPKATPSAGPSQATTKSPTGSAQASPRSGAKGAGAAKSPVGSGAASSTQAPGKTQDFIDVNGKRLPLPAPVPTTERQAVRLSSLDESRKAGMASANYSQSDYNEFYSGRGRLAGWTIDDVAEALRTGKLHPKDVVVDFVLRKGQLLMHNTRSPQALLRAGIPKDDWYVRDMTDDGRVRKGVEMQLRRNNLERRGGTPTVTSKERAGEPE